MIVGIVEILGMHACKYMGEKYVQNQSSTRATTEYYSYGRECNQRSRIISNKKRTSGKLAKEGSIPNLPTYSGISRKLKQNNVQQSRDCLDFSRQPKTKEASGNKRETLALLKNSRIYDYISRDLRKILSHKRFSFGPLQ